MTQDSYMFKFIINFIPTMIFLMFFIWVYKEQQEYINYYPAKCFIDNSTYPIDINQSGINYYWISCSCGKRCHSVSPCLSLYTIDNIRPILKDYDSKKRNCTFYEDPCRGNENPLILYDKINNYIELAQEYQNSTVSCYKNKKHKNIRIQLFLVIKTRTILTQNQFI